MRSSTLALSFATVVAGIGCHAGGTPTRAKAGTTTSATTSATPATSYLPSQVLRSPNGYTWSVVYQPNAGASDAITAISIAAATSSDIFIGVGPQGRIERVSQGAGQSEFVCGFPVTGFALSNQTVLASTGSPPDPSAARVFQRDTVSSAWTSSRAGPLKECVALTLQGLVYAFSGENDGRDATASLLDATSGQWTDVATLGSFVPQVATVFANEAWVGGRDSDSQGGDARIFVGNGTSFTEEDIPYKAAPGEIAGVSALGIANGVIFLGVEMKDAKTGATLRGCVLYWDDAQQAILPIVETPGDAPAGLLALDGTIYLATRTGRVLWLDEKGSFQNELAANLPLTATCDGNGTPLIAVVTSQGPVLAQRQANPPPAPPAATPSPGTTGVSSPTTTTSPGMTAMPAP